MGGNRSHRLAIAALVLVCLLRTADSQSECRCFRVVCFIAATTAETASLCSAIYYVYCGMQL